MSGRFLFRIGFPLAVALLATTSCGDNCSRARGCPATSFYLEVIGATDGGVVSNIEAVLSGPTTIIMSCDRPESCGYFGHVTEGSYTLEVTAPGFQAASVPATLTVGPVPCGCPAATLQPSTLTLTPSGDPDAAVADVADGGLD